LFLVLGGAAAGLLVGFGLYYFILAFLQKQKVFPFITPSLPAILLGVAALAVLFLGLGMAAAWLPARQSGKIDPSSAMALGDID
jgi:ABC-type antimicrobial peptide transport system permease subunit